MRARVCACVGEGGGGGGGWGVRDSIPGLFRIRE